VLIHTFASETKLPAERSQAIFLKYSLENFSLSKTLSKTIKINYEKKI